MDRAAGVEELLDGPLDDVATLRGNLRDLARVNRWLGGARLSVRMLDALAGDAPTLSVVDVGTGAADLPLAFLAHARATGRRWAVTGVDSRPEVLAAATVLDPRLTATPDLDLRVGDGRRLPFQDGSVDVAHASLVTHHLEPGQVVAFLGELGRISRRGVVVNDLVRGRAAYAGAWLLTRLATGNRFTRHDAPLSVRRAYTIAELTALAAAAGLTVTHQAVGLAGHRWAFAARRRPLDAA